jgi:hypothetical protein
MLNEKENEYRSLLRLLPDKNLLDVGDSNLSSVSATMSPEEYFAMDAVNQSLLKQVLRSPAHAKAYLAGKKPPTPAMQFGTAVHSSVLNPQNFENEVAILPDINRRTKEGKLQYEKFLKNADGKAIIDRDRAVDCIQVGQSVARSQTARELLSVRDIEQAFLWKDEKTSLVCKARVDAYSNNSKKVIDLKTAQDASPHAFARSVAKFGYHIQAAFYLRAVSGFQKAVEAYEDGWRFYIVAVESTSPYSVASYKLDQRAIIEGDSKIDQALGVWAECRLLDDFQGYPDEVITLSLPDWALTEPEDYGLEGA